MRNLLTLPMDGQYSGINWRVSLDEGDTPVSASGFMRPSFAGFTAQYETGVASPSDPAPDGSSIQGWQMRDNDYTRFDPDRSYTQNYGDGDSFNNGSSGVQPTYVEGNRG